MAEILLSSIVKDITGWLASASIQEVGLLWGVIDELSALYDTISIIEAVLLDAEEKQSHNHQVKIWLKRLEEVVHDADDLMDAFNTELALLQQGDLGNEMITQVCTFFSTSNQLIFRYKLGHRIKAIKERLAMVKVDMQFLYLEEKHMESRSVSGGRENTHSYVLQEEVIGRDEDRMAIIEFLMNEKIEENVEVVAIVGVGGVGKTTLAQLIYNDEKIQKHFDLKMWVCVSNDFNVKLLVEKILKSATSKVIDYMEMDQLQKELRKEIRGKKYLLILDDVWNDNRGLWLDLKTLLSDCAKGSRIIVTTLIAVVGENMSTMKPYILGRLDKVNSWSLFEKVAFRHGKTSNSNILKIGTQIVEKCGGIPLAIKTIGRILYFKSAEKEWSSFLEMKFSGIPQKENDIIPTLKLSYDNLPVHLKHCFVFCKLFPKDYAIDLEMLINLWMALGFVKQSNLTRSLVDIGYEYFFDLLWRSFFEDFHENKAFYKKCKMHGLMHDLATQIGGIEWSILQPNQKGNITKSTHYIMFNFHLNSLQQIRLIVSQAKKIRTILLLGQSSSKVQGGSGQSICNAFVSSFKLVRILDLHNLGIKVIPNSIGKLRHLRYLDLSTNADIKALPDSITMLYNLQTLRLLGCEELKELPRNMKKLVNLVNLDIFGCISLTHMPSGLDRLNNLQTLTKFVLEGKGTVSTSSRHGCGEVGELRDLMELNNLRGKLEICNLGNEKDAKSANLVGKHLLHSLRLCWHREGYLKDVDYEETLEGLQPHPNLKLLGLYYYNGIRFSSWFPSLSNLLYLDVIECRKCQYLPPLAQFHSLKRLYLKKLDSLEYISNEYSSSSTSTSTILPSLETLKMFNLTNLKGWWREEAGDKNSSSINNHHVSLSFPHLSRLVIDECPKLAFFPISQNIKEMLVQKNTWKPFQHAMQNIPVVEHPSSSTSFIIPFSSLSQLALYNIDDLQCLPEWLKNLTSLNELWVLRCPNLKCLSPGIHHLTSSLQVLWIDRCDQLDMSSKADDDELTWLPLKSSLRSLHLTYLPQLVTLPLGFQHLTSLQQIEVKGCENLIEIPEWITNFKSLYTLKIVECPNLRSLPQGMRRLTSLQKLKIKDCPNLYRTCQRERGEDWPKVAHVPELILRRSSNASSSMGRNLETLISRFCNKGVS